MSPRIATRVAVGMPVTRHPPHRPVRALLTHTVPTSDIWRQSLSHTLQPAWPALPTLRPAQVRLWRVLLGPRPFLHSLLRPSQAFVRLLRWYYAAVRLPAAVHPGLIAHRLLPAVRVLAATDDDGVSRFSRVEFHAGGLRLRRAAVPSRWRAPLCCLPYCVTPSAPWIRDFGAHNFGIPSLPIPLSNASSAASRPPSHGSGPGWFATPFL